VSRAHRKRRAVLGGVGGFLGYLIVLGAFRLFGNGDVAVVSIMGVVGAVALAGALFVAPALRKRRMQKEAELAIGVDLDIPRLRNAPADLELLAGRIASVGLLRSGEEGSSQLGEYSRKLTQSFVITSDGETVDMELGGRERGVIANALWLAQQLQVPLMDGRTSQTYTFMPDELGALDEDLVVPESESESESESETETEVRLECVRRAARERQGS
jgi:hypothetical protein